MCYLKKKLKHSGVRLYFALISPCMFLQCRPVHGAGCAVASALTPQMPPLIVGTSLAKGALTMAEDGCTIKSLTAICDMGSMLSYALIRLVYSPSTLQPWLITLVARGHHMKLSYT